VNISLPSPSEVMLSSFRDVELLRHVAAAIPMAAFPDDKVSFWRRYDSPRVAPMALA
jgi:hypothetical protein